MENIQSNIQKESIMENSSIQQLFQSFIDNGGEPKVTSFKRHLDKLINEEIKPLCGRSGKSGLEDGWRNELKARFSGRGAKWVKVSVEEIISTAESFEDSENYIGWIKEAGYAWIRFTGPRVANGVKSAAFEVRTGGSKIDHPKQLHYISLQDLDDKIESLGGTPHAMRLENQAMPKKQKAEDIVNQLLDEQDPMTNSHDDDDVNEDMMGDIEELMALENEDL